MGLAVSAVRSSGEAYTATGVRAPSAGGGDPPATASAWACPLGEVEAGGPSRQDLAGGRGRAVAHQEDHGGSSGGSVGWPRPFTVLGPHPARPLGPTVPRRSVGGGGQGPDQRGSATPRVVAGFVVGEDGVVAVVLVAELDGHQFRRPSRTTTEGTNRVRTKNVSSRMPAASPSPISWTWVEPVAVNTPKVPARMRPAEVTVVPVASTARRTATRMGAWWASSWMRVMTRML